ncbi:MAG: CAP domain-containing protein [Dehalococcoidales bacterium]|nr:CAP domain-containing protein [Dehalococcoidales bacterium]
MKKISLILALFVLLGVASCAPTVPQEDYDKVSGELSTAQSQLVSLQTKLTEAEKAGAQSKTQITDLNKQIEAGAAELKTIKTKLDALTAQKNSTDSELAALQTKYTDLDARYQALLKTPAPVAAGDLEQALFKQINDERTKSGVKALSWNASIYSDVLNNSKKMAANQRLEYPVQGTYQQVYRAAGYTDAQKMAESVLLVWKNTEYYKDRFLYSVLEYGSIAVYISEGVYNITYVADSYK